MKELLHILKEQPELNKQLNSQSDYEIKTLIIQAYPQHRKKSKNNHNKSKRIACFSLQLKKNHLNIYNINFLITK